MSIATLIRNMAAAGATPEAIAIAVEAIEGAQAQALAERQSIEAVLTARRAADAAKTRRYRERGGGNIPDDLRAQVMERDSYTCQECGSGERLQCDHIHPVSKGGETALENLQVLCRTCNARKRDRIRKADVRANSSGISTDGSPDTHGQDALPLALPSSPQTPQLPTHTRRDSSRTRKARRFDEFWQVYPSKVGKKAAAKAYDAALIGLDGDDPEEIIIAGLRRALPGWASGKFIPNPATWLNQGRWDDQPLLAAGVGAFPTSTGQSSASPKFNGPQALRQSVVAAADESFAVKFIDPATWRPEDRTLVAANGFAAKQIERTLRDWLVSSKVRVEVAQPEGAAA